MRPDAPRAEGPPRPRDDLPEMPGEGAAPPLRDGAVPGRGPRPVPELRVDRARQVRDRARLAMVPAEDGAGHRRGLRRAGGRDDDRAVGLPGCLSLQCRPAVQGRVPEGGFGGPARRSDDGPPELRPRPGDVRAGRRRRGRPLADPRAEACGARARRVPGAGLAAEHSGVAGAPAPAQGAHRPSGRDPRGGHQPRRTAGGDGGGRRDDPPLGDRDGLARRCADAARRRASSPWPSARMAASWPRAAWTARYTDGTWTSPSRSACRSGIKRQSGTWRSAPTARRSSPGARTTRRGCGTPRPVRPSAGRSGTSSRRRRSVQPRRPTILTASWDHKARLWDAATGGPVGRPMGHDDRVSAVAFSPDGKTILTGGYDRTARLLGRRDRQPDRRADPAPACVASVAFSPDGKLIITGCYDGTARLWDGRRRPPPGRRHPPSAHGHLGRVQPRRADRPDRQLRPDGAALGGYRAPRTVAGPRGLRPGGGVQPRRPRHPDRRARTTRRGYGTPGRAHRSASRWHTTPPWRPSHSAADSQIVLTGSLDRTARLWDAPDGHAHLYPLSGMKEKGQGGGIQSRGRPGGHRRRRARGAARGRPYRCARRPADPAREPGLGSRIQPGRASAPHRQQ